MHVVATAGHVDHGKSTLVRLLTGTDPDRWAEEQRRGMTIDLGFAWTHVGEETVAFVDVPGHERFVTNMLAGVGPAPAALVVVAADEGWMPQTEEHVSALDALGVRHAVAAISRADLADPATAQEAVRSRLAGTSMGAVRCVPVSATTGSGLADLRVALAGVVAELPTPDTAAPVRLWVDRSFSVRGAGTVVTGTLTAGTLREGDRLAVRGRNVTVRGLQCLGAGVAEAPAVARVAVNLRGVDAADVRRGDPLLATGSWPLTATVDVRVLADDDGHLPTRLTLHVGSASHPVRVRPLGEGLARITLPEPLPLRAGDRALLRDPGRHLVVGGIVVLDPDPPALVRRGAAATRARALRHLDGSAELRRRGLARAGDLTSLGLDVPVEPLVGDWVIDPEHVDDLRSRLGSAVSAHAVAHPLESGPTVDAVRRVLCLPDRALVEALVRPPLVLRGGRVVDTTRSSLPAEVADRVADLVDGLAASPFAAPDAGRLAALGLGSRDLAAAERAGALLRVADGVVLLAGADVRAAEVLAALPQPFTVSQARGALGTTRRVAVPLLELLDRRGLTRRWPDDRRTTIG